MAVRVLRTHNGLELLLQFNKFRTQCTHTETNFKAKSWQSVPT